ncbi:WD40/YVTN/BNR-like repeat-containing protein [Herbaspirillum sp. NPDC087042]|uniref:WD40/YVTN/BNR-like repeat-containing protein n=1 Tax=Herbaspirillum sp. NPDC087042 TaxID=3364004 RepID=UPI00382C0E20
MKLFRWIGLLLAALLQMGGAGAAESMPAVAVVAPLASRAPLVAVTRAGSRLVALGDEGVVISSADGRTWKQARQVPYDGLLNAACFTDAQHGWAVGYGGVILSSADGGETWQLRQRMGQGAVLLSVACVDKTRVIVVGAYGKALQTRDGGDTWTALQIGQGADADLHLNAILLTRKGSLMVAAEGGAVFRSVDDGKHWARVKTPATGSLWGALVLHDGRLLMYGMSGRIVLSQDDGESWQSLDGGTREALTGATQLDDGRVVLVGNGGVVTVSAPTSLDFTVQVRPDRQALAAVAASSAGDLVVFGAQGASTQQIGSGRAAISR